MSSRPTIFDLHFSSGAKLNIFIENDNRFKIE